VGNQTSKTDEIAQPPRQLVGQQPNLQPGCIVSGLTQCSRRFHIEASPVVQLIPGGRQWHKDGILGGLPGTTGDNAAWASLTQWRPILKSELIPLTASERITKLWPDNHQQDWLYTLETVKSTQ